MVDAKNCNVVAEPHVKQKRIQSRSAEAIVGSIPADATYTFS